jgi:NAD(P)-dependent dehydrogenase (short-subunit alcohol dehydrogenase family)
VAWLFTEFFTIIFSCLPLLEAKATADVPSRVINIGSINGLNIPAHETYAYSASKAAVHQLTKHLASKLGHRNILVNAIAPGSFQSKMMKETLEKFGDIIIANVPVGRIGSPEDIAGTAIYLSSRAGQYTNGAVIVVDGGVIVNSRM